MCSTRYARRHTTETNWRSGRAQVQTLNGHTGTVTCLSSDAHRVVSGSDDGSLVLWTYKRRSQGYGCGGSKPPPALAVEKLAASFGASKGKAATMGHGGGKLGGKGQPDYHQGYNAIDLPVAAEERPTAIVAAATAAASEAAAAAVGGARVGGAHEVAQAASLVFGPSGERVRDRGASDDAAGGRPGTAAAPPLPPPPPVSPVLTPGSVGGGGGGGGGGGAGGAGGGGGGLSAVPLSGAPLSGAPLSGAPLSVPLLEHMPYGAAAANQQLEKLRAFHGHGGPIWCVDMDTARGRLVSGSYDKTLKVEVGGR